MMGWFTSSSNVPTQARFKNNPVCERCGKHIHQRYCLRLTKDVCYHCCNDLRSDMQCTENCPYSIQEADGILQFHARVDSRKEFLELLESQMDQWIKKKCDLLDGQIPLMLAREPAGKEKLKAFLEGLNPPADIPISSLYRKLDIPYSGPEPAETHEEAAGRYLELLIQGDCESTISMLFRRDQYRNLELRDNYLHRLRENSIMRGIQGFELLKSGLSEDKKQGFVYFGLDQKYKLTLHCGLDNTEWLIAGRVFGDPETMLAESKINEQMAGLLHAGNLGDAGPGLRNWIEVFPDSADLQYYCGLYYTFRKDIKKARGYFFTSMELDPSFIESKYNLAYLIHTSREFEKAEKLYREILSVVPEEYRSLNNLASILITKGEREEARNLLERCLKVQPDFDMARKNLARLDSNGKS